MPWPTERDLLRERPGRIRSRLVDSLLPQYQTPPGLRGLCPADQSGTRPSSPGTMCSKRGMSVIRGGAHAQTGDADPRAGDDQQRADSRRSWRRNSPGQIDADSAAIMRALTSDGAGRRRSGFDSVTLFSMFIPDSYEFYWTVTPEEFVKRMKREYDRFWTPERDAERKRSGLSRLEVMTLASIVYERDPQDRRDAPRRRRLRQPPDARAFPCRPIPTVKYAMQDFGLRRILYKHLKYPIALQYICERGACRPRRSACPGSNAIDAVLELRKARLYLLLRTARRSTATTISRRTLREHNANARAYSAELNRRKIK